jgi:site-specific DNA recombinase
VIRLLRDELLQPAYIKQLVDLVNEEANAGSAAARAEVDAVAGQLADAKRKLDNLYRAIEDGALDLSILAPRIREVKAQVDVLSAKRDALANAGTPDVRLADDATITRYVDRLHAALDPGSAITQQGILGSWISRIEADETDLTARFTRPPRDDSPAGGCRGPSPASERSERPTKYGGGGSRTRVRSHSAKVSTCVVPGVHAPPPPGT